MGHGKRLGQLVEGFTTHRAVWILGGAVLLVALTEKIGRLRTNRSECQCYNWLDMRVCKQDNSKTQSFSSGQYNMVTKIYTNVLTKIDAKGKSN